MNFLCFREERETAEVGFATGLRKHDVKGVWKSFTTNKKQFTLDTIYETEQTF